jgi:SAM-dependent methyltransferase
MSLNITKPDEIFAHIGKSHLLSLLNLAHEYEPLLNVEEVYDDYCAGNPGLRDLYDEWALSVKEHKPAFELYGHDLYMNEAFNCWKLYSRRYLLLLRKYLSRPDCVIDKDDVKTVLDLGCGCGYTTVGLSSLFPDATVCGTNLSGTLQYKIAEDVCRDFPNCIICDESHNANLHKAPDLVFASEFFEHLTEPLVLLDDLVSKYRPKYFVFANTFTKMSLGHFERYWDCDHSFDGKKMSREFISRLRKHGYVKVPTKFFNNRPSIYMLTENTPAKSKPLFEVNYER